MTNETRIGPAVFAWGTRTFVMGILNVTPDSFSGDGLQQHADVVAAATSRARAMVDEGAHLLDIGGESTRPGHAPLDEEEELRRVVPVVRAVRAALPATPITIDTTKPSVAEAALDAGADAINDVWGVHREGALSWVAAARKVPIVLMHNRETAVYDALVPEVVADLRRAIDRALAAGVAESAILIDPGIGFGKTAEQNLELLGRLGELKALNRPILLGTSRKSTLGKVLGGVPPEERLEATLATTALGVAAGIDIVRVHDVGPNVRAARMADAIVRGGWREAAT